VKAIDRKLVRDLLRMKGQVLAIALIIVSGVATYVMFLSTMDSLELTRDSFYREYGFADAFVSLKRAPESMKKRIGEVPGVEAVETRVVSEVKLKVRDFGEPVTGRLVSLPEHGQPHINRLYLRKGRLPDPSRDFEAVISEAFAEAHGLGPGDEAGAVINGRWRQLRIVGVALSPEFVMQIRPGALSPDYKRYAIVWMGRKAVETAYGMDGAFNDAVMKISHGVDERELLVRLDNLLARYGGLGAYLREDQLSHRFLNEEFKQLDRSATIFPSIFIGVAAFLLNVVITRIVSTQRDQLAALKAFGYSNAAVGAHYVKMVMAIVAAGVLGGVVLGWWFAGKLAGIYMVFYRFPYLKMTLEAWVVVSVALIAGLSALAGAIFAVRRAALLAPAEALRPEPPARYSRSLVERLPLGSSLSQPTRMIIRGLERRPLKSLLTVTGISLSCAILVSGMFSGDSIDYLIDVQFKRSQKEDMSVAFIEPSSWKAVYELEGMEGVSNAEPLRFVPVRLVNENRSYRTTLQGIEPSNTLQKLLDSSLEPFDIPPRGIVLTDYLGEMLGVRPGDMLTVEVLEGARPVVQVPVAGFVKQYIGISGYMEIESLNRLAGEGRAVTGALLSIDRASLGGIYAKMIEMPMVAGTAVRADEIQNFYDTQAEVLLFFTFIASVLASTIAFGVIYNSARISLSERSRELASLRVLGYTKAEISYIFLGELAVLTLASLPMGFLLGHGISAYIASALSSDLYRIPLVIKTDTYAFAAAVVLASAVASGLIVRYRLGRLDLVEALKARE